MKSQILLLLAALSALLASSCSREAKLALPSDQVMKASIGTVTLREVPSILTFRGTIHAGDDAILSSRAMGPVIRELAKVGDRVGKGDVLLEIEERMNSGMLTQAIGALAQAKAAQSLASTNMKRFEALYETQACSQLELDMARMQFETADGAVKQAQGGVDAAGAVAHESSIRAPFDGIVIEKFVHVGDLVAPGRPLIRVQTSTGRDLQFTARASDAARIAIGSEITCTLDHPSKRVSAIISELSPSADPMTHSVLVRARLRDSDSLAAGFSALAEIPGELIPTLLAPRSAIFVTGGLHLVSIVDDKGTARTRAVTVGRVRGDEIEILSGLTAGDMIVLNRTGLIAEGTRIERANG